MCVFIFRNDVINFANYVDTAFVELPQYGLVFALEINRKFFRAIRIDSEVCYIVNFVVALQR